MYVGGLREEKQGNRRPCVWHVGIWGQGPVVSGAGHSGDPWGQHCGRGPSLEDKLQEPGVAMQGGTWALAGKRCKGKGERGGEEGQGGREESEGEREVLAAQKTAPVHGRDGEACASLCRWGCQNRAHHGLCPRPSSALCGGVSSVFWGAWAPEKIPTSLLGKNDFHKLIKKLFDSFFFLC